MKRVSTRLMPQGHFDQQAFLARLTSVAALRGVTMKDVARATGTSSTLMSRMKNAGTSPDVAGFLALCSWANADPMDFWRTKQ